MTLVRSGQPLDDELNDLQARAVDLDAALRSRDAELDRAKSALAAFKIRYREAVGGLHEELDELERAIDEAELGEIARRLEDAGADPARSSEGPLPESAPRFTSDAVRKLFRDVAKAVHPDLARDQLTRDRRHALMIEANRAYALGDEERLRWILQAWENSPESVQGDDPEATRARLIRRIAQIEDELQACDGELEELKASPLWKLKTMVDEAAAKGKDLAGDMVRRLKRDIMVARNRLDAIRHDP